MRQSGDTRGIPVEMRADKHKRVAEIFIRNVASFEHTLSSSRRISPELCFNPDIATLIRATALPYSAVTGSPVSVQLSPLNVAMRSVRNGV